MNTVVCTKQIIDPEITPEQFKLDPATYQQIRGGLSLVISTYDQNALEVALQVKEKRAGEITALCLGSPEAKAAVKSAMGMGVDAGVLVSDPPLLAEELGLPCLTFVSRLEVADGTVTGRVLLADGYERVEAPLPLVATVVSDESNVPRFSKLKDIMTAARKPIPVWTGGDLELDPSRVGAAGARIQLCGVSAAMHESKCEFVGGDTPEEQAERLALRLRELKAL